MAWQDEQPPWGKGGRSQSPEDFIAGLLKKLKESLGGGGSGPPPGGGEEGAPTPSGGGPLPPPAKDALSFFRSSAIKSSGDLDLPPLPQGGCSSCHAILFPLFAQKCLSGENWLL